MTNTYMQLLPSPQSPPHPHTISPHPQNGAPSQAVCNFWPERLCGRFPGEPFSPRITFWIPQSTKKTHGSFFFAPFRGIRISKTRKKWVGVENLIEKTLQMGGWVYFLTLGIFSPYLVRILATFALFSPFK